MLNVGVRATQLTRKPYSELILRIDRRVQNARQVWPELRAAKGTTQSMSRKGNCYDNAVVESFWGKLKMEMAYHRRFATKEEAKAAVFDYIEMFYNRNRLHAALGYVSPEQFEMSQKR